ncbi:MAG: hypothetical protein L0220_07605, partial [Acidobacteria bacterium]|nr:hypothetical protein [Acidobacteriota bacterium]
LFPLLTKEGCPPTCFDVFCRGGGRGINHCHMDHIVTERQSFQFHLSQAGVSLIVAALRYFNGADGTLVDLFAFVINLDLHG